jgi:putative oxidoreductase
MSFSESKPVKIGAMVVRIVLGAIFIYAAYIKLAESWRLFAAGIASYEVLPMWAVEILARTLPWFELLIGVCLIVGRWLRVSTVATSGLLLVFFSLMVRAHIKGMTIDCGCFGPGETISWKTLLRDGSMLAGSLVVTVVAFLHRGKPAETA